MTWVSDERYISEHFIIAVLKTVTFMMWRREFALDLELLVPRACCQLVGVGNGEQAHWVVTSRRARRQSQSPEVL